MNRTTIAALNGINWKFYRERQVDFSRTRQKPWPGWERVVSLFADRIRTFGETPRSSVLDIGCGNGRFLKSLAVEIPGSIRYVGVDSSLPMLVEARQDTLGPRDLERSLVAAELATDRPLVPRQPLRFDLAVAFGLMHHIPSFRARRGLLLDVASALEPGGLLAVSFWQFGEQPRYLRRAIRWEAYNRRAEEPIDLDDLEEGDYLLAWGELPPDQGIRAHSAVRYCHFTHPGEADELVGCLGMSLVDCYSSDGEGGRQNLYYVLAKP